jgi:ABC-type uncharacterized transport system substrate-binding protein
MPLDCRHHPLHAGLLTLISSLAMGGSAAPARAHPHIWVEVETTIVQERGTFSALKQRWTFDEFYTAGAIDGLDTNKDGKLDSSELAELAKVNMEGLKEFDFFTFATLGGQRLTLGDVKDYLLEHVEVDNPPGPEPVALTDGQQPGSGKSEDNSFWSRVWRSILGKPATTTSKPRVLALTFTVPLTQPVLLEADGFEVATYDPAFFIWFDLAKTKPARLSADAPPECKAEVKAAGKSVDDLQRLGESFFNQMGGAAMGAQTAKTIQVSCKKSS